MISEKEIAEEGRRPHFSNLVYAFVFLCYARDKYIVDIRY